MKNSKRHFLILFFSVFSIYSCEDEFLLPSPEKVENTQLYAEVLGEFLSVWRRIDEGIRNPTVAAGGQVVIDQATVVKNGNILSIDYGNIQKLCADGKTRRGKIEAAIKGDYGFTGSSIIISFIGFRVDDIPVDGSITISAVSSDPQFNVHSTNFSYRDYLLNLNSIMTWHNGFNTYTFIDDTLTLTLQGTASRQSRNFTLKYETDSQNTIKLALGCNYRVVKGLLNLRIDKDSSLVKFDFIEADGCNDLIKVEFVNERYNTFIKFSGF